LSLRWIQTGFAAQSRGTDTFHSDRAITARSTPHLYLVYKLRTSEALLPSVMPFMASFLKLGHFFGAKTQEK
jgi:hypothetical protein